MMKKYILICFIFLSGSSPYFAQNKIYISPGFGYYISNSENNMKIMGEKKIHSFPFFSLAYLRENVLGMDLMIEYSYRQSARPNTLMFYRAGEDSPEPISSFGIDVSLISHDFDFDYVGKINEYLSYGAGPSFIIVNRIIEADLPYMELRGKDFYDKLASTGLGLNGFLDFSYPVTGGEDYFFINSRLKLRYTYSLTFDKGIRNLDNYYQEFLTTEISVGIGAAF